ncbi:bifunctional lysylphosphatidylglycerol synthetase/lysine--tRNA ligase LysX [Rhodococcus aerolatus]
MLVGRVVSLAAAWTVVALLLRRAPWTRPVNDLVGVVNLPSSASLFNLVVLILLASALRRRLRVAWAVLLVLQVLGVVVGVGVLVATVVDPDAARVVDLSTFDRVTTVGSMVVGVVVAAGLVSARRVYPARLQRASRLPALTVLVGGLAASAVVSVALTEAFPRTLPRGRERLGWALRVVVGIDTDGGGTVGHRGHGWVAGVVGVLSAAAVIAALVVFLRSARAKQFLSETDELGVRRLLVEHGERDSLGYFATRHDKSVLFAPGRDAAVTYRVLSSVSLASADPLGAPAAWGPAIEAWLAEARTFGWYPAVLSASEEGAQAYVAAGLKALPLGDEAIVDVDGFTLEGATMQPVRRAVNRVTRAGYTLRVARHVDLTDAELAEVAEVAERWIGEESERGFSMALSRVGDRSDGRCVAVLAHDAEGRLRGVQSYVPWGTHGLSLDLMRRDPTSENGITEFLVSGLLHACDDLGVRRVSLNFAMFRGIFSAAERVGAGPLVRVGNRVLTFASRFWQLESLYRSNERYLPRWTPRYLCYDSSLSLTRVAAAAGSAEGFLPELGGGSAPARTGRVVVDGEEVDFVAAVTAQERAARHRARPTRRLSEQERVRRQKLGVLQAAGMPAYPVGVPRTTSVGELVARWAGLAADAGTGEQVSVAGRVRALRDFGGLVFAVLQDGQDRVQAIVSRADVGADAALLFRRAVDLGDHVSVTGEVVASRSGELSVRAASWVMASKCLVPLPDVHAGFSDPEARVRQRYLDLVVNPEASLALAQRTAAVRALREGFQRRGFSEVETPMLQAVHGGANARPFVTHINAYDTRLYLRIAPELFLKRLCVGGMGKVFELNRNFRNEGADATHNPEFTSLEAYQAYADYDVMRELTRELVVEAAVAVHGRPVARRVDPDGTVREVDLSGEWPVVTVHEAVSRACGTTLTSSSTLAEVSAVCRAHGVALPAETTAGEAVVELYDELVEGQTQAPTFYTDFPVETSPLTRVHRSDPRLSERWDLVAFGAELGTAYSELVDPVDQRERLTEQSLKAAAGDPEAMQVDEAFLTALEYAMPPTGGLGIGVDRVVMMLTGGAIRSTLAFPFVRPGAR